MTDPVHSPTADLRHVLDVEALRDWIERQRWYASKSRQVTAIEVVKGVVQRFFPDPVGGWELALDRITVDPDPFLYHDERVAGGPVIRIQGDFHLGQTLLPPQRSVIIEFEREAARPPPERRRKRSPLRDVASMLRSFAYVTSAVQILRGCQAPADFEQRARDTFLEHCFAQIDPTLLPAGESAVATLLSIFELEKAIYGLQYALENQTDWLPIRAAGIARLLEAG